MATAKSARNDAPDRITTLHPAGKRGVRIERSKYDEMRRAILQCVPRSKSGIALAELTTCVARAVERSVFGPGVGVTWYLIAVKQDLEARGEIELVPRARPQHIRRLNRQIKS